MKKIILILVLFFFVQIVFAQYEDDEYSRVKENPEIIRTSLIINKIEKRKEYYLIQVIQNHIYYTIVSLKTKEKCKSCVKLKEGKEYDFLVTQYFEYDRLLRIELSLEVIVDGVKIYVPMIGTNVFLTPNLKGLCYTKPNSDDNDVGYQYFPARYYNTDFYNCLCPCFEKSPPTMFINPYKYNATNPILVPADFDLQLPIN